MHALSLYSERLRLILSEFVRADGTIDATDIASSYVEEKLAEICHVLEALPVDLSDIRERLDADPDLHGIENNRRLVALADWLRVVIGLVEREVEKTRGQMIAPNDVD